MTDTDQKNNHAGRNSIDPLEEKLSPAQQKLVTKIKIKLSISLVLLIVILSLAYEYVETSMQLHP